MTWSTFFISAYLGPDCYCLEPGGFCPIKLRQVSALYYSSHNNILRILQTFWLGSECMPDVFFKFYIQIPPYILIPTLCRSRFELDAFNDNNFFILFHLSRFLSWLWTELVSSSRTNLIFSCFHHPSHRERFWIHNTTVL